MPNPNRLLFSRFWHCASGFWRSPAGSRAWLLTGALVGSTVLQLILQFRLNYWSRDFFDAFGRRDGLALRAQAWLFLLLASLSILVAILSVWARMTTQRKWREWLTRQLLTRWLANDSFRHLHFQQSEDENPEYRIAEDARVATDTPVNMAVGLLAAVLNAITFIGILWNVGGDLSVEFFGSAMTVPKYLVLAVAAYSAALTVAMTLMGRQMLKVITGKNMAEAEFRSVASDIRELGTAAGDVSVGALQFHNLGHALDRVMDWWRDLCAQFMRIVIVSHGNSLAAPVIGWILCAPKYLVGTMTLGQAAQAVAAFVMVQGALNWLVDNYAGLAECLSSANRVGTLLLALDEINEHTVREAGVHRPTVGS